MLKQSHEQSKLNLKSDLRLAEVSKIVNKLTAYDIAFASFGDEAKNYLSKLADKDFNKVISLLQDLFDTSPFATAFFIEKIPTLLYYDLLDKFIAFIGLIRHFGSRDVAYLLGGRALKNDDLERVLRKTDLNYYKVLLAEILVLVKELEGLASPILRSASTLQYAIQRKNIKGFLNFAVKVKNKYGIHVARLVIETIDLHSKSTFISLEQQIRDYSKISNEYLEFCFRFPKYINTQINTPVSLPKDIKLKILQTEHFDYINKFPGLLKDPYFFALVTNWHKYEFFHKQNILSQLSKLNYVSYLLKIPKLKSFLQFVNKITNNRWLTNWVYVEDSINNKYLYELIQKTLIPNVNYKFLRKRIFSENRDLILAIQKTHDIKLLKKFCKILIKLSISQNNLKLLQAIEGYLLGDHNKLLTLLSNNDIIIKTWERNPWVDYARSDEIYSCTSIGKSADIYAPTYIADLNVTNLDVYNNSQRIGRIHLALVKDVSENLVLLVDSIEGSDRLMRNSKRLDRIYCAICQYALYLSIDSVLFNSELTFNNTPKLFVQYLQNKIKKPKKSYPLQRVLNLKAMDSVLPYPLRSFLESLGLMDEGNITGYLVRARNSMDRVPAI